MIKPCDECLNNNCGDLDRIRGCLNKANVVNCLYGADTICDIVSAVRADGEWDIVVECSNYKSKECPFDRFSRYR
jgi:hypothetical protein